MTIVGVDPGSHSLGVAIVEDQSVVAQTRAVVVPKEVKERVARLRYVAGGVRRIFGEVAVGADRRDRVVVVVEDGIYRQAATSISVLAEVRGIVYAEAWARGWDVEVVNPRAWKSHLSAGERAMRKNAAYVAYINRTRGLRASTADEVDAALIARWKADTQRRREGRG
jgi:Holliday junction resolvasome RuvABC endonuclease subunit